MTERITTLDLRTIPVFERHPRIFDTWDAIAPEETLQIINDHDPKPLHYQFEGEYKDSYSWQYVTKGPTDWVVNITKLKKAEASEEDIKKRVLEALDTIRPYLQADGGDVDLVELDNVEKIVRVRLTGACGSCPSAQMTLKAGVERKIQEFAPEIKRVESV